MTLIKECGKGYVSQDWPDGMGIPEGFYAVDPDVDFDTFYDYRGFVHLVTEDDIVVGITGNEEAFQEWQDSHVPEEPVNPFQAFSLLALPSLGVEVAPEELAAAQESVVQASGITVESAETGEWVPGEWVTAGVVRTHQGTDYTCRQSHSTQADWAPDLTPALWAVKGSGTGTEDDPIPAARGMEYQYGLYYLDPEDGLLYLCAREGETGTIILNYLPHELMGHYFVLADN